MRKSFLFFSLSLFIFSCATKKKTIVSPTVEKIYTAQDLIKLSQSRTDCRFLTAKGSIDIRNKAIDQSAKISLYSVVDSASLIAVRKVGIEVFRALLRPDSLTVLDRFNQQYSTQSTQEFQDKWNLPFDTYLLQDILLSGVYLSDYLRYSVTDSVNHYSLLGSSELFWAESKFDKNSLLPSLYVLNQNGQELHIEMEEWKTDGKFFCPSKLYITLYELNYGKTEIRILLDEINWNKPEKLKFEIPAHYTKI